ncbi:unnamed protein product [Musa acuminata subsp. burmannicoides]
METKRGVGFGDTNRSGVVMLCICTLLCSLSLSLSLSLSTTDTISDSDGYDCHVFLLPGIHSNPS